MIWWIISFIFVLWLAIDVLLIANHAEFEFQISEVTSNVANVFIYLPIILLLSITIVVILAVLSVIFILAFIVGLFTSYEGRTGR